MKERNDLVARKCGTDKFESLASAVGLLALDSFVGVAFAQIIFIYLFWDGSVYVCGWKSFMNKLN